MGVDRRKKSHVSVPVLGSAQAVQRVAPQVAAVTAAHQAAEAVAGRWRWSGLAADGSSSAKSCKGDSGGEGGRLECGRRLPNRLPNFCLISCLIDCLIAISILFG